VTNSKFTRAIQDNECLSGPIYRAAQASPGLRVLDTDTIGVLSPLVRFILTRLGLPWLRDKPTYDDSDRANMLRWIRRYWRNREVDPIAIKVAGESLLAELENISTPDLRMR